VESINVLEAPVLKLLIGGGPLPPLFQEVHRTAPVVWIESVTYRPLAELIQYILFNRSFWVLLSGILLLERLLPAKAGQRILSVGLAQDAVWLFLQTMLNAVIATTYVVLLESAYRSHLSFLTLGSIGRLPAWARFAWGVILVDLVAWFHHWVRHKVLAFWEFHSVHHSQRELNLFTDLRYHIVEYIVARSITTIPLLMLAVDTPRIYYFTLFHTWFTRLQHANVRTDFGPLRYLLVTPQSHRVHHSIEERHRDKNFGVLFSVWDQVFGTQYRGWHEYPETGIPDENFPHETTVRGMALFTVPIRQHTYPFLSLYRKSKYSRALST
jgi:sterol desaturase/sphingolipid hydroxylase (fatty acid hydroxylase superfamily)